MKNLIQKQTCLFCFVPVLYERWIKNLAKNLAGWNCACWWLRERVNAPTNSVFSVKHVGHSKCSPFSNQRKAKTAMESFRACCAKYYKVAEFGDFADLKLLENRAMITTLVGFWFRVLIKWITCITCSLECSVNVCVKNVTRLVCTSTTETEFVTRTTILRLAD